MIDDYFKGDRKAAAAAANISVGQLNNLVSQGREVKRLDGGGFVLMNAKTMIFAHSLSGSGDNLVDKI